jgi:dihydroflavonol-4-reductase
MKVLVTGATGLVGNNVVRTLLERGHTVRALVRQTIAPRPLQGLEVEVVHGDLCDAAAVGRACEGVDCVVHAAGYVQLGRSRLDVHRAVNVEGTRHVAQAARRAGIRMLHVSSVDALGAGSPDRPADEETPMAPPAPCNYAISKREAEDAVLQEMASGLEAVIVNPGFMLGPWDWKPSSGRMLLEVAKGRGLFAPRGWYSVCDVRDVAAAIVAAIEQAQAGHRYILAGQNMTYLEAWRLFADVTGGRKPLVSVGPVLLWLAGKGGDLATRITGREPDVNSGSVALAQRCKCYSSGRAQQELGYRMRPVRQSAEDAWKWFREFGYV